MSDLTETKSDDATGATNGSEAAPVVKPLSKADPSVAPDWNDHVQEYFNQDAHPGEAVPMATHEAKE
jgi:phage/plasmid primase-like uncharacterized protein